MESKSDDKNITLRKMTDNDLDDAIKILSKWNMAPLAASREIPNPERSSILIENAFVACDAGKVVGVASYIDLSDTVAETASMAVDPAYKGMGVGFRLQEARLQEMIRRGFRRVLSETDRPETIDWYVRHFGYRISGTHPKKHTFSLPDVDEWTILELDLEAYGSQKPGEPGLKTRAAGLE